MQSTRDLRFAAFGSRGGAPADPGLKDTPEEPEHGAAIVGATK